MTVSLPRLAAKSAAVVAVAAGITLASSSMASAGQLVVVDTGYECGVVWQNDDGSYSNWWNPN